MLCKQCRYDFDKLFHDDFVNGICLPCQVQNRYDKWWGKVKKELANYNSLHHADYDFNSFCYDSSIGVIKHKTLSNYLELKRVCKREYETWEEYRQQQLQPELPF